MRLGKRAPQLSFNQDLMSLTNSAYRGRGRGNPLASLGKRAPSLSINADLQNLAESYREGQRSNGDGAAALLHRLGKRSPSLSINQVRNILCTIVILFNVPYAAKCCGLKNIQPVVSFSFQVF